MNTLNRFIFTKCSSAPHDSSKGVDGLFFVNLQEEEEENGGQSRVIKKLKTELT